MPSGLPLGIGVASKDPLYGEEEPGIGRGVQQVTASRLAIEWCRNETTFSALAYFFPVFGGGNNPL